MFRFIHRNTPRRNSTTVATAAMTIAARDPEGRDRVLGDDAAIGGLTEGMPVVIIEELDVGC